MKHIKIPLFVTSILIALFCTISSCVKDNFELDKLAQIEYSPNLAAPLVYSSLTIEDILMQHDTSGLVSIGSDNFCTLVYKGNLFTLLASELIQIPDQSPPALISPTGLGAALALAPSGQTIAVTLPTQTITFASGTATTANPNIDSIVFKQGDIKLSIASDFKNSGQIVLAIPSAKKNGVAFTKTIPLTYSGTVPVTTNVSIDLTGYHFDMTNGGSLFNQFNVSATISLTSSGIAPLQSDKITISQSIENMKFDRIYGDIGQHQLSPNKDTVAISIFNSALNNGAFTLSDARVKVSISNSYGVPIDGKIITFDGYNATSFYAITGNPNPLPISSPTFSQLGQTLTNSYILDNSNSNIVSVINNLPNNLVYKIDSKTNPQGGVTHNNFVLDTSKFKVDITVELPLDGKATGFTLLDTVDFEFNEEVGDIDWALIRSFNSNGFPLYVKFQAYFVDNAYNKIDSVFKTQPILKSGIVNSAGKVIAPTANTEDVTYTKARLNALKNAKHLLIRAIANTTNNGTTSVKIYSDYKLDVKLGIQVQLKTKL